MYIGFLPLCYCGLFFVDNIFVYLAILIQQIYTKLKMSSDEIERSSSPIDMKLYGLRWWIAGFVGLISTMSRLFRGMFGIVNDVYAAYFHLTYVTLDWLTLAPISGIVLTCLLLALLIFHKIVLIRQLAIAMAACFVLLCMFHLAAYVWPIVYPLMFLAQVFLGFSYVALEALSASFAISWFPENEVGVALASKSTGARFGSLLGFLIPSNLFVSPSLNDSFSSLNHSSFSSEKWFQHNQTRFIAFSGALLFVSAISLGFFIIFYNEKPPSPPTAAQALLTTSTTERSLLDVFKNVSGFFKACSNILLNKVFVQISFILSVVTSCFVIQKMLIGEMLRFFFIDLGYSRRPNVMSGVCSGDF